ncbi:MAG: inositol monophosphatase, partial [Bacteroidia bacterium]|nr:inositol monophosphatase [Bacteroidia bacterium]
MPDLSVLLSLAQDIAEDAVRIIEKDINKYQKVEQDLERDVKVLADRGLESVIVKRLLEEAQYPVLSEEAGFLGGSNKNTDYRWIVDPLDGSLNFSRGIPINCISIALWKGMEPLLGVVCDFNRDETFSG